MKSRILTILSVSVLSLMAFCSCANDVECQEGINLLPMYGRVKKCNKQLESDKSFLSLSDENEPDRAKAAIQMMDTGWYYLHQGDYDTAMKRLNQAWLLDSTNVAVYASFAVVLDLTLKTDDAIKMLDISFDKIAAREAPEIPTQMSPGNDVFIEFIVANAPFTYKKTGNPDVGRYLYKKLDVLDIPLSNKERLKNKLKAEIAGLD